MARLEQNIPLVLASASVIRAQMLKSCGLHFSVAPSHVDEAAIKAKFSAHDADALALALAEAKARAVSADYPDHFTIGADQLCEHQGEFLDKPESYERGAAQLARLQNSAHRQISAVVLLKGSEIIWQHVDSARLSMRALNDEQINAYLRLDQPLQSCGAYKFESYGRHLFTRVEGQEDVIKGLPLLALLNALHERGAVAFRL